MPNIVCTSAACDRVFDTEKQLNNHLKGHHVSPVEVTYFDVDGNSQTLNIKRDENNKLMCPSCFFTATIVTTFRSHVTKFKMTCGSSLEPIEVTVDGITFVMKPCPKNMYKCVLCDKDIKDVHEHLKNEHRHHEMETSKKKRHLDPSYDNTFFDCDKEFKRAKADFFVKGLGLELVDFKNTEGQNTMISSVLVNEKSATLFRSVPMLGRRSLFNITLQDSEIDPSSSHIIDIERQIKKSNYPLINDAYGSFVELNDTIDAKLAKADPVNVLNVFPGAIIYSADFVVLILSAELYLRDGYIDSHTENTGDSFPEKIEAKKSKYSNWKICKITEADGGEAITKLVIGHQKYNILITGSLVLLPLCESPVPFGPKCPNTVKASKKMDCSIFFRNEKVENIEVVPAFSHDSCRQLSSAFHHRSTYFPYRCTLFESNLRQSATSFNMYKLPNHGYGCKADHPCRSVSRFFAFMFDYCNDLVDIKEINKIFPNDTPEKKLNEIINNIKNAIQANEGDIDIFKMFQEKDLSKNVQALSSIISTANKKIAENTSSYVQMSFND